MGNSIHRAIACSVSLAVLALLAPLAFAFPCERMSASSDCQEVWNSGLPDNEKIVVAAGLIDDVRGWNTAFGVSEPPAGTAVYGDDLVKGAWVRIMSMMPSVYEGDTLLSPGYGEVTSKSRYDVVTPYGTEGGDCRTDYSLSHSSRVENYLNGAYIGSGEIASFNTDSSVMNFQTNLIINTELSVSHYRWYRNGRRGWICRYSGSEVRRRTIVVSDSVRALRHQPSMPYTFKIQNRYYGIAQVAFNASGYSWFRIQFNPNSYYEEHRVEFDPFFRLEPYYILNFHPVINKTVSSRNVQIGEGYYQVASLSGCTITLGDYFRNYTYPCPTAYTPLNLKVTTDKDVYSMDDRIGVFVEPRIQSTVSYGNESVVTQGATVFRAQRGVGLIVARADGVEAFKSIQVTDPTELRIWGVGVVFCLLIYLFWVYTWRIFGVKK